MDKSLGDLMNWLEKNDEADNTVIIFMSDNGGLAANPDGATDKFTLKTLLSIVAKAPYMKEEYANQ